MLLIRLSGNPRYHLGLILKLYVYSGEARSSIPAVRAQNQERIQDASASIAHAQHDYEMHVQNNRAKRIDVAEVESIGNSKYSEVSLDFNFQIGGSATTEVGAADVQLGATRALAAFDGGPLQLAYEASLPGGPDASRGHYKLIVAQSRTEVIGTQSSTCELTK